MLNEMTEIKSVLDGKRFDKKNTYRTTLLLAKYFLKQGYNVPDTRKKIFNWAKKFQVHIPQNLNRMIGAINFYDTDIIINSDIKVFITKKDIEEIISRFDRFNQRLLAFAFLCYAKMNANSNGEFILSMVGFSLWVGISKGNIYSRYLNQYLIGMGYIKKVNSGDEQIKVLKKMKRPAVVSKNNKFKILVPCSNRKSKESVIFKDNNLREEFQNILNHFLEK